MSVDVGWWGVVDGGWAMVPQVLSYRWDRAFYFFSALPPKKKYSKLLFVCLRLLVSEYE